MCDNRPPKCMLTGALNLWVRVWTSNFVCLVPNPMFRPQEKKSARCCRFESLSDSGFIAPNLAFYRPYKAQTDI